MVPVRLMGAHARGRVSYAFSLASCAKFVARGFPDCNGGKFVPKARIACETAHEKRSLRRCFWNALPDECLPLSVADRCRRQRSYSAILVKSRITRARRQIGLRSGLWTPLRSP